MRKNVRWDIDVLSSLAEQMSHAKDNIEANKDFLKSVNIIIEGAWQGKAGGIFDERMDIDAENLEKVINGMNSLIDDFRKVITECYEGCEESISAEIQKLRSII